MLEYKKSTVGVVMGTNCGYEMDTCEAYRSTPTTVFATANDFWPDQQLKLKRFGTADQLYINN